MADPPPPRRVVIDNLDDLVRFDGAGWFQVNDAKDPGFGNFGPTYLSTLHGTNTSAQLSFTFDGSAVTLWGSNNPRNESGIIDPTWACLIDGVDIGTTEPFPFAENNWPFCDWKDGTPGEHTLTVRASPQGQTFWVDRIDYTPSPSASVPGGSVISVDHRDNAIKLGEGWGALGGTANFTQSRGAIAEVEFVGTRLSWWGFIPGEFAKGPTTGSYAIDGQVATSFSLRGLAADQGTTYNQKIFETPLLSAGPHRILVIYQGSGQTTPLPLTNLLIEGGNFTSPLPGEPSIFAPPGSSSTPASPSNSSAAAGDSKSAPIGAIVGGVLGGLAIIAATIVAAFLILRRRKKRESVYGGPHNGNPPPTQQMNDGHTPIYYANHTSPHQEQPLGQAHTQGRMHRSMPSGATDQWTYDPPSSLGHRAAGSPPPVPTLSAPGFASPPLSSTYTSSAAANVSHTNLETGSSSGGMPAPLRKSDVVRLEARNLGSDASSRVVMHEDSGVRMDSQGNMMEVPPLYTAQ